jgi:hypothetical protein
MERRLRWVRTNYVKVSNLSLLAVSTLLGNKHLFQSQPLRKSYSLAVSVFRWSDMVAGSVTDSPRYCENREDF